MILTDEEIYTMYSEPCSDAEMVSFARAVEAAVLAKLREHVEVLVEYQGTKGRRDWRDAATWLMPDEFIACVSTGELK